MNLFFVQSFCT